MDGYLKIKTKLDNNDIDKDINELENKIKNIETDNLELENSKENLEEEIRQYENLCNTADKYREKINQLNKERKSLTEGGLKDSDVPKYNAITSEIDQTKQKYIQTTSEIDKQAPKIEKVYAKLDKVKTKQSENNKKAQEFKDKVESIKTDKTQEQIDGVGKSIQKQISKIGKMALAVVGIRTAWGAVRSAIDMVSQYNNQVSTDLEYMRYCIANILAPVVQAIIKLLYVALSYINAISTAWFGISLFSNSSAKNFQKMKNSAAGTAKSAKEIQKSLQGFDEMNILQENSNTGVSMPSVDLSNIQGDVPIWLKWIIDNKELILSIITGIVAGLLAIKLGASLIMGLGIGVAITGIVKTIQSIVEFIKDPSWNNFAEILKGLAILLTGVAIAMLAVNAANPVAWIILAIAAVAALAAAVIKNWSTIKQTLSVVGQWINEKIIQPVGRFFSNLWEGIITGITNAIQKIKNSFYAVVSFFQNLISKIVGVFSSLGTKAGEVISGAFKTVVNGVLRAIENILNSPIRAINKLVGVVNKVPGINLGYLGTFNLPRLAKGGVISQPTQAIIGEAGREAVVPLENNLEWLDMLADKLALKIGGNNCSYILNIDGKVVQRGIAKRNQELAFATNGR